MIQRKTPAPSNTGTLPNGADYTEAVNTEITWLARVALERLINVAGTNVITANCAQSPLQVNQSGNQFAFLPPASNTGNVTLNVDSCGALPLRDAAGAELPSGYLDPARLETCINMGGELRLTMPVSGGAGGTLLRALFVLQKTNGTSGGTATGGSRQRYPLNTVVYNNIPGLTLDISSNIGRMSLPARAYERIEAEAAFYSTNATALFLRNITNGADFGDDARVPMYAYGSARLVLRPTLAATKVADLEYYAGASQGANGLGVHTGSSGGAVERFGYIYFESRA